MDALGRPDDPLPAVLDAGAGAHPVYPRAGRVHDDTAGQADDVAVHQVTHPRGPPALRARLELLGQGVVEGVSAGAAGRQDVLQTQALRGQEEIVEVVAGAEEVVGADARLEAESLGPGDRAVPLGPPARAEPARRRQDMQKGQSRDRCDHA